ncbi:MAG: RsmE family RNA methyltransferase [Desulfomonilia bacterium]|jgi:16S rRNA (uracil1498-N3)-methyltransferase
MPRFFAEVNPNGEAFITGRDVHHIHRTLRRRVGDELPIRDNEQGYLARITRVSPERIDLQVLSRQELSDRGGRRVRLGMALIDLKDMDDLIRTVTELGVAEVHPVICARSNVRDIGIKRLQRWRQIVLEAIKQCERRSIPQMLEPLVLEEFLNRTAPGWPCRLVASLSAETPISECREADTGILIGPEGGFSDAEMERILDAGFTPVSMGKTVLRACTAAIAAASVLAV